MFLFVKIGDIDFDNGGAFCSDIECKKEFPIINKKPVLIDFEKSVIKKESFIQSMGKSEVTRIENRGIYFNKAIFVWKRRSN